jgi:hypothetical protein
MENAMKRIDPRIIIGALLIVGGVLMLLQTMGLLENVSDLFFGGIFLIAGAAFLYVFATGSWWGAIPGCILLGLGATILSDSLLPGTDIGGALFLGSIGLAFWLVYLSARAERWWAIIPAGVMTTLAGVTLVPESFGGFGTGGVFFLGLAATFLLVALLADHRWAYYPAAALGVMGVLATTPYLEFANYLWAAVLIALGAFLIFRFFRTRA